MCVIFCYKGTQRSLRKSIDFHALDLSKKNELPRCDGFFKSSLRTNSKLNSLDFYFVVSEKKILQCKKP